MTNKNLSMGLALAFALSSFGSAPQVAIREVGQVVLDGIPEIPARVSERLRQYQNTRSASLYDWLPSGGMLVGTRFGDTNQIHEVAAPMGARKQLTFYAEPVSAASVSPDAAVPGFLFQRDVGGSENYQIYHFDTATGRDALLTDGKSRHGSPLWAPKGSRFAFSSTARNGRDNDVVVADALAPDAPRVTLEREGSWSPTDWSPDGKRLLLHNYISANESYYHVWNVETGEVRPLLPPSAEKVAFGSARFAPDGRGVYFTSDEGGEFKTLRHIPDLDFSGLTIPLPAGKNGKPGTLTVKSYVVLTAHIPWDVTAFEISSDGKTVAFVTNEDGASRLRLMDAKTRKEKSAPAVPMGIIGGLRFRLDGAELAFTLNSSTTPGDVFSLHLKTNKLTRWTESETGGLDPAAFAEPELVRFPTFDEADGKPRMISAFYYRPKGEGKFPVVISVHGGPEAQYRPSFSPLAQYYVNELGAAVLAPNVRGSSGYGKTFLTLDNGFLREDSVKDIGALLDWIASRKELDAERVAVAGGSYGGYMTFASMTHFNDRLRCGAASVGISNFVTFLENTKAYRRDLRRVEYGDEGDSEMRAFLEKISPTANAGKITKPMFVAQGLNDPRVPAGEAEQMVAEMRRGGGDVWYFLAKDEGHGFAKKPNRDLYQEALVLFFEKCLLPEGERQGEGL